MNIDKQESSSLEELKECYEIMLKTARRCARDLRHAIDQIAPDHFMVEIMRERYSVYRTIFDDLADYRMKIHAELDTKDYEISYLKRQITEMNRR